MATITGTPGNDPELVGTPQDDLIEGLDGNDVLVGGAGNDVLRGGPGGPNDFDIASYIGATGPMLIDLPNGLATQQGVAGGGFYDAGTDNLISIEGASGSKFDDVFIGDAIGNLFVGNEGNDSFQGGGGNDVLDGGAGNADVVSYSGAQADPGLPFHGVVVDLGSADGKIAGYARGLSGNDQGVGSDILYGIENVLGSAFNDVIFGNEVANVLTGGNGNDLLRGEGGDDTLNGGAGSDTADYLDASAGVLVNLAGGIGFGTSGDNPGAPGTTDAGNDKLISIENVRGSNFDDQLLGDAGNNFLDGAGGDDLLAGGFGNNILHGGDRFDPLLPGGNPNVNVGIDTVTYIGSEGAVKVDLGAKVDDPTTIPLGEGAQVTNAQAGAGAFPGPDDPTDNTAGLAFHGGFVDVLIEIENVFGSKFNDDLRGDDQANALNGGDGNDVLEGRGGNDVLNGGNGIDVAVYDDVYTPGVTYSIVHLGGQVFVDDKNAAGPVGPNDTPNEGTDTLIDIEFIQFDNGYYDTTTQAFVGGTVPGFDPALFPV